MWRSRRLSKYDGRRMRNLAAAEVGQIAGRAGRHVADGTFGVTAEQRPMDERVVARVEEHRFEPLKTVCWRNADLDFSSVDGLLASLGRPPPFPFVVPGRDGEDQQALTVLARDTAVRAAAVGPERVAMLWEVCQVPDFRKTLTDAHAHLLGRVYRYLVECDGRLPADWVARQVGRLERTDGDIDTLMARIAGVRTWTYIAYRAAWLDDAAGWQERTRRLEDLLSDALHERLTQRFVDRRTAVLARRLREGGDLMGAVAQDGSVFLEGETVGRLDGFRYTAAGSDRGGRPLVLATQRVLRQEAARRVDALAADHDGSFALDATGRILWNREPVARLVAGATALSPGLRILPSDLLETAPRRRVETRLREWVEGMVANDLAPLVALARAEGLSGHTRGIAYRLAEALGTLRREAVADLARSLSRADRQALGRLGVRIGRVALFVPAVQKSRIAATAGPALAHPPGERRRTVGRSPASAVPGPCRTCRPLRRCGLSRRGSAGAPGRRAGAARRGGRMPCGPGSVRPHATARTADGLPPRRPAGRFGRYRVRGERHRDRHADDPQPPEAAAPDTRPARFAVRKTRRAQGRTVNGPAPGQRLDQWLWRARFFKTRGLATRLCQAGRVRVNRRPVKKAHHILRVGDILTFPQAGSIRVVRVEALAERRGPAPEAARLYASLDG